MNSCMCVVCNLPSITSLLQGPIPEEPDARTCKKNNNSQCHSALCHHCWYLLTLQISIYIQVFILHVAMGIINDMTKFVWLSCGSSLNYIRYSESGTITINTCLYVPHFVPWNRVASAMALGQVSTDEQQGQWHVWFVDYHSGKGFFHTAA